MRIPKQTAPIIRGTLTGYVPQEGMNPSFSLGGIWETVKKVAGGGIDCFSKCGTDPICLATCAAGKIL